MKSRGIPTWCYLILALAQTGIATAQWYLVDQIAWARAEYSPEVFAAAHVDPNGPPGIVFQAVFATAFAAIIWALAISRAPRE